MLKYAIAGFVAAIAIACGSSSTGDTVLHDAEQDGSGMCPSSPKIETGTAAEGAACKAATDCAPTCCPCASNSNKWLASECVNSVCKSANACTDTEEASFCVVSTTATDASTD